ncbi:MAG: hypothetical protein EA357_11030 [Micavibrio sp.]|nr:MAG: hypothetical protein EA357_11030 [Micavibrio sp.]
MTDRKLHTEFSDKKDKKAPQLMAPDTYRQTLEKLLAEGEGRGKTANVGAYLMEDIKIVTETSSGEDETARNIKVEKLYIVMDTEQYPTEHLRGLVVKDIAKNWGGRTIGERDLDLPDFKGPGIWTGKQGAFEFDYKKADTENRKDSIYTPDPEAYRVCATVDETVIIPVQWGTFTVEAGGTLAIREKDVPELAAALQSIRDGKATAEEALYKTDDNGNSVARFDVYGMEPGFLDKNYDPVKLKPETQRIAAAFAEDGGNRGRSSAASRSPGGR